MASAPLTAERVEYPAHLDAIAALRVEAWRDSGRLAPDIVARGHWLDRHDASGMHWIVRDGDVLVGAARIHIFTDVACAPFSEELVPHAGAIAWPAALWTRLVVKPSMRGRGIAQALDEARFKHLAAHGTFGMIAIVYAERRSTFQRLGFRCVATELARHPAQGHCRRRFDAHGALAVIVSLNRGGLGWTSETPNQVSVEFALYAGECALPVLDIGAAYGVATHLALAAGATVIANDLVPEHLVELARRCEPVARPRLKLLPGRFPDGVAIPPASIAAVHASNVLHFLRPGDLVRGLAAARAWLVPVGRLFVLTSAPYQAHLAALVPQFLSRKQSGERWPGDFALGGMFDHDPELAARTPSHLHVLDPDIGRRALDDAGFVVDEARMCRRTDLPDWIHLDGRENLALIAHRPA